MRQEPKQRGLVHKPHRGQPKDAEEFYSGWDTTKDLKQANSSLLSDYSLHFVYLIWYACRNKTVCELGKGERKLPQQLKRAGVMPDSGTRCVNGLEVE